MKAVIVILKGPEFEKRKEEIALLAETAGYTVEEFFTQAPPTRPRYFVGKGKVEEIGRFIEEEGVELVIFEDFLSSRQLIDLEEALGVPVMDRYDLILNVFEAHAASREAMLQIELARLRRKLPYIKLHANRRVREDHPGFGSSGEYVVHSTLAGIHKRIKKIEDSLKSYSRVVAGQVRRRRELGKVVALAGYTNVGKTTLLNVLTGTGKPARDELFTTLGTKTGRLDGSVFITDTIGFIRNLPPELVHAFRSTLRSIRASDLILLMLDASEDTEEFLRKKEICEETLMRIGTDEIPLTHVLNKLDRARDIQEKRRMVPGGVEVSAREGTGLEDLKRRIREVLA